MAVLEAIGGTAMRDAVLMAERYLREHGSHDRQVLLVITDGNDNASIASMKELRRTLEHGEMAVFAVGLFGDDDSPRVARSPGARPSDGADRRRGLFPAIGRRNLQCRPEPRAPDPEAVHDRLHASESVT
jgi:hypothetical protein